MHLGGVELGINYDREELDLALNSSFKTGLSVSGRRYCYIPSGDFRFNEHF